jgi:hypothetical protein
MLKITGSNQYGVVEYTASSEADVVDLPLGGIVGQGSTCFVIPTANVYMYDEETDTWIKL